MRHFLPAAILFCALDCGHAAEKGKALEPAQGQVFYFSRDNPRHATCDVEFRHPSEKMWPCFFYGRPAEGTFEYDPASPKAAFTIVCDRMCQAHGDQRRKIIGELVKPDKPPVVSFVVKGMSAFRKDRVEPPGKGKRTENDAADLDATLDIDGKKQAVQATGFFKYEGEKGADTVSQVRIVATITLKGSDLGLKAEEAQGPISVRIEMLGVTTKEAPPKSKK